MRAIIWEYLNVTTYHTQLAPMLPGTCTELRLSCHCPMGCMFESYGEKTSQINGNSGIIHSHIPLSNISICAPSKLGEEALVLAAANSLAWNALNKVPNGIPMKFSTAENANPYGVSSHIAYLPPITKNELRYVSGMCIIVDSTLQGSNCSIFYSTVMLPAFEEYELPVRQIRRIFTFPVLLPEVPASEGVFQLRGEIVIAKLYSSLLCPMSTRTGESNIFTLDDCLTLPEWPYQVSFDPETDTFLTIDSAPTTYTFDRQSGWTSNTRQVPPFDDCASEHKLGSLGDTFYGICQEYSGEICPEYGTGELFLHVVGQDGGKSKYATGICVTSSWPNGHLDIRRRTGMNNGTIIFYPYFDIPTQLGSCLALIWEPGSDILVRWIPLCQPTFRNTITPYFLFGNDQYLFGHSLMNHNGEFVALLEDDKFDYATCEAICDFSYCGIACAEQLPVSIYTEEVNTVSLASLQKPSRQPSMVSQSTNVTSPFFIVQVPNRNSSSQNLTLPCLSKPFAKLDNFEDLELSVVADSFLSGLLEEEYLIGESSILPRTKYHQVSYLGPNGNETDVPIPATMGAVHYVNLYPSLKVVYRQHRSFQWSSIPSNAYGVFKQILTLTGCFIPLFFLVFCASCVNRQNEATDKVEGATAVPADVSNWGASKQGSITPRKLQHGERALLGLQNWKEADEINANSTLPVKAAAAVDLFKHRPLYRPPTRSGVIFTVSLTILLGHLLIHQARVKLYVLCVSDPSYYSNSTLCYVSILAIPNEDSVFNKH